MGFLGISITGIAITMLIVRPQFHFDMEYIMRYLQSCPCCRGRLSLEIISFSPRTRRRNVWCGNRTQLQSPLSVNTKQSNNLFILQFAIIVHNYCHAKTSLKSWSFHSWWVTALKSHLVEGHRLENIIYEDSRVKFCYLCHTKEMPGRAVARRAFFC